MSDAASGYQSTVATFLVVATVTDCAETDDVHAETGRQAQIKGHGTSQRQ